MSINGKPALHKPLSTRLYRNSLAVVTVLLVTWQALHATPVPDKSAKTCHNMGILTKLAAQERDNGASPQIAQDRLNKLLIKGNSEKRQMARKMLILPIALAWVNRDLTAANLYSLGFFVCLASHNKMLHKNDNVYLIQSAKLCQRKIKKVKGNNHACMQLAYLLLLQDKLKKAREENIKKFKNRNIIKSSP